MSSAVFFHNFNEVNLKLWTLACLATASLTTFTVLTSQPDTAKLLGSLLTEGTQAETSGLYRKARQDFDLALLQARARGDKKVLLNALIDSARIDHEFEEDNLAISLAREAADLCIKLYGEKHEQTAEAMAVLADVLSDNEESLSLYKKALTIFKQKFGNQDKHVACILMEMSYCYDAAAEAGAAISASRAALRIFEQSQDTGSSDYARALIQYANLMDLEPKEKTALLNKALLIQEQALGKNHPALCSTLSFMAADQTKFEEKDRLLRRAMQIDESVFGSCSVQVARDLAFLADASESAGKIQAAHEMRKQAAVICRKKGQIIEAMSKDFLESYSLLLHELKFEKEAARIDAISQQKPAKGKKHATAGTEKSSDSENDPEYWQRTELVPIDGIQKFASDYFDHIQIWYDRGNLRLEAFCQGEIVWKNQFGQCPLGILNAKVDKDTLTVSWRDGEGPVWHNDVYKLAGKQINLLSSTISDAFAQQIEKQVDDVLNGDTEAVNDGAVEKVPATYINNNFIADAIRKGEHKALQIYGQGDAAAAAERLSMIFELCSRAINTQRSEVDLSLSSTDAWLDALQFQQIPISDYITALNDYGFFLQQSGCLKQSVNVLSRVAEVAPGRAVAHLNLADSYWKLGKRDAARSAYKIYLRLMKDSADRQDLPSRVFQRIGAPAIG